MACLERAHYLLSGVLWMGLGELTVLMVVTLITFSIIADARYQRKKFTNEVINSLKTK